MRARSSTRRRSETLAAGETTSLTTSWDTAGVEGEHVLFLVLDVRDDVTEQREDNNVVRVPVVLQDADTFVSPVYVSPNGDDVQDEAAFFSAPPKSRSMCAWKTGRASLRGSF